MNTRKRNIILVLCASGLAFILLANANHGASATRHKTTPATGTHLVYPTIPTHLVSITGGTIHSVAVSGSVAYVGQGDYLSIFDIHDPVYPRRLTSLPFGASSIQIEGALAYVIGGRNLYIFDIHEPLNPVLIGSYYQLGESAAQVLGSYVFTAGSESNQSSMQAGKKMQVIGSRVYIAAGGSVTILDVQEPSQPLLLGTYYPSNFDYAHDVMVVGMRAYILCLDQQFSYDNMEIVDVSVPDQPKLLGVYEGHLYETGEVWVAGNYAYIAAYGGLKILDINNPAAPTLAGSYELNSECCTPIALDIELVGSYAYLGTFSNGLIILDVHDPTSPAFLGSVGSPPSLFVHEIYVSDSIAYVADEFKGTFAILDISDPTRPAILGSYTTPFDSAESLQVIGEQIYIATSDEMVILDYSEPDQPRLLGSYPSYAHAYHVIVENQRAYLDGGSYWYILDVSNPSDPTLLGQIAVQSVSVQGNYVYNAYISGDYYGPTTGGLQIIDVSDPAKPAILSDTSLGDSNKTRIMGVSGNIAVLEVCLGPAWYISSCAINLLDVSDPRQPILRGDYQLTDSMLYVSSKVIDNRVYYSDSHCGLTILDISNPDAPALAGKYSGEERDMPTFSEGMDIAGSYAYIACDNYIHLVDIDEPERPQLLGIITSHSYGIQDIQVRNGLIYIAHSVGGLEITSVVHLIFLSVVWH